MSINPNNTWPIFFTNYTVPIEIIVFSVSGFFVFLAMMLSFFLMFRHLKHFHQPVAQSAILRILFMVPLYSLVSLLSVIFSAHAIYFDLARDCYEAYALYQFFKLLTFYLHLERPDYNEEGDDEVELLDMPAAPTGDIQLDEDSNDGQQQQQRDYYETRTGKVLKSFEPGRLPFPFCCFGYRPGNKLFGWIRRLCIQYVYLKVMLSAMAVLLTFLDVYHDGSFNPSYGFFWITIALNVSATLALYGIVLYYDMIAKVIAVHRPLLKFISLKILLFFVFWQSVTIAFLYYMQWLPAFFDWSVTRSAATIENLLICIEMTFLAIFNFWAYSYITYRTEPGDHTLNSTGRNILNHVLSQKDLLQDTREAFDSSSFRRQPGQQGSGVKES